MAVDREDPELDGIGSWRERFDSDGELLGIIPRHLNVAKIDPLSIRIRHRKKRKTSFQPFIKPELNSSWRFEEGGATRGNRFYQVGVGRGRRRSKQHKTDDSDPQPTITGDLLQWDNPV
jgi:hypothetical protein